MTKKEELNNIINNALKRAAVYKSKQSDYNAALHYHGYFEALKELTKLDNGDYAPQTTFKLEE